MPQDFIAKVTVVINAPASKVWEALITPSMIKEYFFGTDAVSDWKVGSTITYKGVWEGKPYEDKGVILEMIPEKSFVSSYWSVAFGLPDAPENYKRVAYTLSPEGSGTKVELTQDKNPTEESQKHSEANWTVVLTSMKKLLEK